MLCSHPAIMASSLCCCGAGLGDVAESSRFFPYIDPFRFLVHFSFRFTSKPNKEVFPIMILDKADLLNHRANQIKRL